MVYEWDAKKAKGNRRKHRISFEDAATVFLDPLALTFPTRIIPLKRNERSPSVVPAGSRLYSYRIAGARTASESSAHGKPPEESASNMKKASAKGMNDDLRPEYDLSQLKGGVRGKYYREATAGTNLVLIEHELADVFPDSESVNRALRMLVNTAAAARHSTPSSCRLEPSREVGRCKTRPLSRKRRAGANSRSLASPARGPRLFLATRH